MKTFFCIAIETKQELSIDKFKYLKKHKLTNIP